MTLWEHLEELRRRLFVVLGGWVLAASIAFFFRFDILAWLRQPLPDSFNLHYTTVFEPFVVAMNIAGFGGLVLSAPIIGWQTWAFIAPALYEKEKRYAIPFIAGTACAFLAGIAFGRYVALPFALPLLLSILGEEAIGLLSIKSYTGALLMYMGVFGSLFEMPVLSFLLARLGFLKHAFLSKYRRHSIVITLIVAAVVTPTADPFNLAIVAIPLLLLYEVSIFVVRLAEPKEALPENANLESQA